MSSCVCKAEAVPRKKKPFFRWFLVGFLVLIFILGLLIFSTPGEPKPMVMPNIDDLMLQSMLINRVLKESRANPPIPSSTVRLTPEQIQSLLRIADTVSDMARANDIYSGATVRDLEIRQIGDAVELQFPYDTGWRFLFGGEIVLKGSFRAKKEGHVLSVQLLSLRVGLLPLPAFLFGTREFDLRQFKNGDEADRILQAFSFDEKGNLTIVYSPAHTADLVRDRVFGQELPKGLPVLGR